MSAPTIIEPADTEEQETSAADTYALGTGIRHSKIMPQSTTASRTLTMVMTVMCYLACLALGSLIVINKAVDSWTSDISSQITVQIKTRKRTENQRPDQQGTGDTAVIGGYHRCRGDERRAGRGIA